MYGKRGDDAALAHAAVDESLITHADPRCALACAGFCLALAGGGDPIARARGGIEAARAYLASAWRGEPELPLVDRAARELGEDLDAAVSTSPGGGTGDVDNLHLHRTAGFVRVAFRIAFWHAHHTASWRDALIDVASRGGDADTNGAIAGALLGARDGVGAIPPAWVERVMAVRQPGPEAWAEGAPSAPILALTV